MRAPPPSPATDPPVTDPSMTDPSVTRATSRAAAGLSATQPRHGPPTAGAGSGGTEVTAAGVPSAKPKRLGKPKKRSVATNGLAATPGRTAPVDGRIREDDFADTVADCAAPAGYGRMPGGYPTKPSGNTANSPALTGNPGGTVEEGRIGSRVHAPTECSADRVSPSGRIGRPVGRPAPSAKDLTTRRRRFSKNLGITSLFRLKMQPSRYHLPRGGCGNPPPGRSGRSPAGRDGARPRRSRAWPCDGVRTHRSPCRTTV